MIQPEDVERASWGYWTHSKLPDFGEWVERKVLDEWASKNRIELTIVMMEEDTDAPEELVEAYFDANAGYSGFGEWEPKLPSKDSFFLSIHETEDGPVAWIATPL